MTEPKQTLRPLAIRSASDVHRVRIVTEGMQLVGHIETVAESDYSSAYIVKCVNAYPVMRKALKQIMAETSIVTGTKQQIHKLARLAIK